MKESGHTPAPRANRADKWFSNYSAGTNSGAVAYSRVTWESIAVQ